MSIVALLAAILVLVSYALIGKLGLRQFDWANAVCFVPLAIVAFETGAYGSALISFCFGLIAVWRIACR